MGAAVKVEERRDIGLTTSFSIAKRPHAERGVKPSPSGFLILRISSWFFTAFWGLGHSLRLLGRFRPGPSSPGESGVSPETRDAATPVPQAQ